MCEDSPLMQRFNCVLSNCSAKVVPPCADDERYRKGRGNSLWHLEVSVEIFLQKTKGEALKWLQAQCDFDFLKNNKQKKKQRGWRAFSNCQISTLWATANPPEVKPPWRNVLVQARADLLVRHVLSQDEINIKIKLEREEGDRKAAISNVFCPPVGALLC